MCLELRWSPGWSEKLKQALLSSFNTIGIATFSPISSSGNRSQNAYYEAVAAAMYSASIVLMATAGWDLDCPLIEPLARKMHILRSLWREVCSDVLHILGRNIRFKRRIKDTIVLSRGQVANYPIASIPVSDTRATSVLGRLIAYDLSGLDPLASHSSDPITSRYGIQASHFTAPISISIFFCLMRSWVAPFFVSGSCCPWES